MKIKWIFSVLVILSILAAVSTSFSADIVLTNTPVTESKEPQKSIDPNWIIALLTFVYLGITTWLILEQRRSRLDDKFPCISVRAREVSSRPPGATWEIRLVNVGRGPAFIEYFHTMGLGANSYPDGDHTRDIDKVIGPDVGDPSLQVAFALGPPATLRLPSVTIMIRYRDIAGRLFESGIRAGEPYFNPPWRISR